MLASNSPPNGCSLCLLKAPVYFVPTKVSLDLTLNVLEASKLWNYLPRKMFFMERIYCNLEETLTVRIPTKLFHDTVEFLRSAQIQKTYHE